VASLQFDEGDFGFSNSDRGSLGVGGEVQEREPRDPDQYAGDSHFPNLAKHALRYHGSVREAFPTVGSIQEYPLSEVPDLPILAPATTETFQHHSTHFHNPDFDYQRLKGDPGRGMISAHSKVPPKIFPASHKSLRRNRDFPEHFGNNMLSNCCYRYFSPPAGITQE
jgi:hypothetical protein